MACFYRRRDLPTSLLRIADGAERQDQLSTSRAKIHAAISGSLVARPKRGLLSRPNPPPSNDDDEEEDGTFGPASGSSSSAGEGKDDGKQGGKGRIFFPNLAAFRAIFQRCAISLAGLSRLECRCFWGPKPKLSVLICWGFSCLDLSMSQQ